MIKTSMDTLNERYEEKTTVGCPENTELLNYILDENQCCVARMRLFSDGVSGNVRVLHNENITNDRGCLACGSCVDACPVVKEKVRFIFCQNQRTSMSLEHIVGEECRRCYRCVNACPQVEKPVKEYVLGFRRGEKIIHLMTAMTIVMLAFTGVTFSHYGEFLPAMEGQFLKYAHRFLGVCLILLPFLYYKLEKRHFLRFLGKVVSWGKNDWVWIKELIAHLKDHKNNPLPRKVEFNTGQKLWYLFVITMIPIMSLTGLILFMEMFGPENRFFVEVRLIHMAFALMSDILLLLHIYLKYLRNWAILTIDVIKVYRKKKNLVYSLLYNNPPQEIS